MGTVDRIFHALGDPNRLAMIERLSSAPMSVSELAKPFPISLAAVVQHVQILEDSGLVKTEKQGRVRTCRLVTERLSTAEKWISERRAPRSMETEPVASSSFAARQRSVPMIK